LERGDESLPGVGRGADCRLAELPEPEGRFGGGRGLAGAGGAAGGVEGTEAEHATERAQDALGGRDERENLSGRGLDENVLQLRAAAGGLPAEGNEQPTVVKGQRIALQVLGMRRAAGVRAAAVAWQAAGGQAVHQVLEALKDAAEPVPERGAEEGEMGLPGEPAADDSAQCGDDDPDPTGEVGGGGLDRRQAFLLPECLDDYVDEDNPVRVIEAFVDRLDLNDLGFDKAISAETGRPACHPAMLLKLYVFGYLNRIPSSRRLEREAQRNLELVWLTGHLASDFKTIADFRHDNGPAVQASCRRFVMLCRTMGLFSDALVASDASKFKAVNSRDKNFTSAKLRARIERVEESIARYLAAIETADRQEDAVARAKSVRLKEKIAPLQEQMQGLQDLERAIKNAPDHQISLTDRDARSMASRGKGTGIVGYNVQAAVDAKHHLVVAHEVTNVGHDREQLANMARQAQAATGRIHLTVLADRGHYTGTEILTCEQDGSVPYVPKPLTSGAKADGRFGKQDFVYIPSSDV
jgi:transposase